MTDIKTVRMLIEEAISARKRAYAPYSNYMVGAALLTESGRIYTGCNIENAAYGPSNCAERTAFFKAVSESCRAFAAVAIVGAAKNDKEGQYAAPCGVCRQVMAEFCDSDFEIIIAKSAEEYYIKTLKELLPESFGPKNLMQADNGAEL